MMTNHREQVVGRDLRGAIFGQERPEVQTLQREGHMAIDLEGIHDFVPKALQMYT